MRIPTHRGHRSDAKRDTIPTRLRTLFRAEGGHRSELIRDIFPDLHHSITINIKGESYRLKEKLKAGIVQRKEPKE